MDVVTYLLAKKYADSILSGATVEGKSAYQIAVDNGFEGTEQEWLDSLVGITPTIGENGNWFIGDEDTGLTATPELGGYYNEENLVALSADDINEICK